MSVDAGVAILCVNMCVRAVCMYVRVCMCACACLCVCACCVYVYEYGKKNCVYMLVDVVSLLLVLSFVKLSDSILTTTTQPYACVCRCASNEFPYIAPFSCHHCSLFFVESMLCNLRMPSSEHCVSSMEHDTGHG